MPFTKIVFLIGSLALVGIPPFAGFFSKDAIIAAALGHGGWYGYVLFAACLVGAFLTGLYAFRLFFIVFAGEPTRVRARAPPQRTTAGGPALDALDGRRAGGALDRRRASCSSRRSGMPLSTWLDPVARPIVEPSEHAGVRSTSVVAVALGLAGIWRRLGDLRRRSASRRRSRSKLFEQKFYWDELYDVVFYRPGRPGRARPRRRSSSGR